MRSHACQTDTFSKITIYPLSTNAELNDRRVKVIAKGLGEGIVMGGVGVGYCLPKQCCQYKVYEFRCSLRDRGLYQC